MNSFTPKVTVIILNWNNWEDTIDCLKSVYSMFYSNYDVILIDNASTNDSVAQLNFTFPKTRLIVNQENKGFTGGNNQGVRIALSEGADYVWLLNNDTVVEVDTLSKIVDTAEQSSEIGMVSPMIYYYDAQTVCQFKGSIIDRNRLTIYYPNTTISTQVSSDVEICLWGTALLIKRTVLEKVGLLREDYFAYFEDTEFSLRSLNAGYINTVAGNSKIYHKAPLPDDSSLLRSPHYFYYMIRNEFFMWNDTENEVGKIRLIKKLFSKAIDRAAYLRSRGFYEHSNSCIQALIDAIQNNRGKQNNIDKYNMLLIRVILWNPYFIFVYFKIIIELYFSKLILRLKQFGVTTKLKLLRGQK